MKSLAPTPTYSEGDDLKEFERSLSLLVFAVAGRHFAIHLAQARLVLMAVEITPLPDAPHQVRGVIDVHGEVMAVIDTRRLFGMPSTSLRTSDHFVVVDTLQRTVALLVDEIVGVSKHEVTAPISLDGMGSRSQQFEAITRLGDSLVLIHDVEKFLSGDESIQLDRALADVVSTDSAA